MQTEVIIVTRNKDGKREEHYLTWDRVCNYARLQIQMGADRDQILYVAVEGACIFSSLYGKTITWKDVMRFFG